MPDSFFVSSKTRKRKRSSQDASSSKKVNGKPVAKPRKLGSAPRGTANGKAKLTRKNDEELESDATDEDGLGVGIDDMELRAEDEEYVSAEEDERETPAQKRLRLAQIYLDSVKEGLADGEFDAAEIDRDLIASRLKSDVLEHAGKIHKFVADTFDLTPPTPFLRTKGHRLPVTAAVASSDAKLLFTASKDGSIVKWDLHSGKQATVFRKVRTEGKGKGKEKANDEIQGHTDEVLALAISDDGRFLASGGKDRKVVVWDAIKGEWLKSFGGHKDSISALTFRKGSTQLYSASLDRTIKLFDLSVMGYVETLFGHQDHVVAIDALRAETAVSAGARDRTVRFWKVVEESQLVFRGGGRSAIREVLEGGLEGLEDAENADREKNEKDGQVHRKKFVEGHIECVAMVDDAMFVSGGDSGSLCLWTTQKKKPQFTQSLAHGLHEVHSETEGTISTPRWITAVACLRYADLVASGSWEGDIRLWKLDAKLRTLALVGTLPAPGFVNSLQFVSPPKGALVDCAWSRQRPSNSDDEVDTENDVEKAREKAKKEECVLVVAGMGQEPRLGRWMRVAGGAANGSRVFVLHTRTSR
ncbi:WD40 repeat-like protein [Rickenella mellea]|uniref:WD40 repeat-like protein n=1 Tax=Rickenella mellea TaxID=50990 RepID=A0A4Y7PZ40_9AGAM|nr:WD40 repeat-like protein [Rickenella mellea]